MTKRMIDALREVLGISPEEVRAAYERMEPLDVGIFRKEGNDAGLCRSFGDARTGRSSAQ